MKLPAFATALTLATSLLLTACGSGGDNSNSGTQTSTLALSISSLEQHFLTNDSSLNIPYGASGTVTVSGNILGYAFCTPISLFVAPDPNLVSGNTSAYGCDNSLSLTYTLDDPTTVTATLTAANFYLDFDGQYDVLGLTNSFNAYASAADLTVTMTLSIITNNDGTYRFDAASVPVSIAYSSLEVVTDDSNLTSVVSWFETPLVSGAQTAFSEIIAAELSQMENFNM